MPIVPLLGNVADLSATQQAQVAVPIMPSGSIVSFAGINAPTGWLLCDGQEVSRTQFADLFSVLTFQMTVSTTNGSTTLSNPSINPTTLRIGTGMFISGNGIQSATKIVSVSATNMVLDKTATASASGVTITISPFGIGNGSTTFNLPDLRGRFIRYDDNMGNHGISSVSSVGAGSRDSGRTHGTDQGYGTKAPNNAFSVSTSGNKNQFNNDQNGHGHNSNASPGPGDAPQGGWGLIQRSFSNQWTPSVDSGGAGFELRADATPLGLSIYTNTATWSPVNFSTSGSVSNQTGSGDSETRPINLCLNAIIKI